MVERTRISRPHQNTRIGTVCIKLSRGAVVQPEIEEAIGLEIQGIQYLPNKLIRFELNSEGKISEYLRFFLGEPLSADGRFPAVQNRKALD